MAGKFSVPIDLSRSTNNELCITWSNGKSQKINVRNLRLACPCAHCIDEITGEKILNPLSVAATVEPVRLKSVGRYALAIDWSDGHKTGIYSFRKLQEMDQD